MDDTGSLSYETVPQCIQHTQRCLEGRAETSQSRGTGSGDSTNLPAVSTLQLTAVYLRLIEWIYFIFAFNELFTQQTITKLAQRFAQRSHGLKIILTKQKITKRQNQHFSQQELFIIFQGNHICQEVRLALAGQFSWLEHRPKAPRLWVWCLVRAQERMNQ